jgi:FkbH-like protein
VNDLDYSLLMKEHRRFKPVEGSKKIRLALLGDCAVQQLFPLIKVLFGRANFEVEFYQGGFDGSEFEVLDPNSNLYAFKPNFIVIINATQSLRDKFYQRDHNSPRFAQETLSKISLLWDVIKQNSDAQIIQTNFALPLERFYGNYELKVSTSFLRTVSALNQSIAVESESRNHVLLLDIQHMASWVGGKNWFDERFWSVSKSFCSPDYLPLAAKNIVDIALSVQGRSVKCVVLDLDNTLWGGIIGDDGIHGIKINEHGEGEDYYRVQNFLRELKKRGILLAVCSKNDHANAIAPFEENMEMVLNLEDIAVFVANWENKASNILNIQQKLNIGLDSMVFLDDNPFERNLVRELLPQVIVPEIGEDPSDYIRVICELNLFETNSHTDEDAQRTEFYRTEAQRESAKDNSASFEEFLQSLNMKIDVNRFSESNIPRITQLFQRSNQFNLTTNRYTQAQCDEMMVDYEHYLPLTASLKDRFGDHGLISIVVLRPDYAEGTMYICDWLMSCRVLKRGVEEYLMNYVVQETQSRGLKRVYGEYIPTAKNAMVKEFYAGFDFEKIRKDAEDRFEWLLDVASYSPRIIYIQPE